METPTRTRLEEQNGNSQTFNHVKPITKGTNDKKHRGI